MQTAHHCHICGSKDVTCFLQRENVPVHQNLPLPTAEAARALPRGHLHAMVCGQCGFIFNGAFEPDLVGYEPGYENAQDCSPLFLQHLEAMAKRIGELRKKTIVEIGCGNGHFLRRLVGPDEHHNRGIGFDPTYVGPDPEIRRELFGPKTTVSGADIVICRHVIEHIPIPIAFFQTIATAFADATLFVETPCVEWILRRGQIWDLFYEHCSYFSLDSLQWALEAAGFVTADRAHVFGGQYLWFETHNGSKHETPATPSETLRPLALRFGERERELVAYWTSMIEAKRVALWGAGAKGVTLANLIDPNAERIACLVDVNPKKQGRYIPGTGHPIIAPHQLPDYDVDCALIMNPNYEAECQDIVSSVSLKIDLVNAGLDESID